MVSMRGRKCRRWATLQFMLAASIGLASIVANEGRRVFLYTFSDTLPHPGLCSLAESTAEMGGTLKVLGLSKRPGYILIHSHSPTLKFLMFQEVLEYEVSIGRISADDLVIFVDGHDVLLQRPLSAIVEAYERWPGSPYLISGEKNCWPWPHSDPSHGSWDPGMAVDPNKTWAIHDFMHLSTTDICRVVTRTGPYPYPNIGASMGPASKVIEVLKRNNKLVVEEDVNDQGAMWIVILRHAVELNIVIDQNATVFMNMLQYQPGEVEREPCVSDYFAPHEGPVAPGVRERSPPRNTWTNTTPSLVHFNGPSHEDDAWVGCYHAFEKEFRRVNKRHGFFDVDHNVFINTDMLCDYSFYRIKSFHAHPVHNAHLKFLEDFYKLPVDPGLLALRQRNESVVDVTRSGHEMDLHSAAGRMLRQALGHDLSGIQS
eukprot:gnl/TRDRNA2_/TRDRNA2_53603_c0_seq1.p1 gnl/TRDRNA2_/TRDRNA2_53603_c0~~gnl/TRDRNA2_/TRDRNA2_53603_c0_seq1.p1  ORF type:complete len:462 (+),score=65.73 gnl/TRDRNA2_/TRDRNA2_53603_c0_seq1:102-1388(+)